MANQMRYKTILIDPPWPERGGGRIKRGADRHYDLLPVWKIPEVVYGSGVFNPADDSHLYLWATNTFLPHAIALIHTLGFRYITCLTWVKPHFVVGQYFRGQTEQLLFAVRGKGMKVRKEWTSRKDLSNLVGAGWTRDGVGRVGRIIHSAKPVESYELIEAASPAPRLEMFARLRRRGWKCWGNERLRTGREGGGP